MKGLRSARLDVLGLCPLEFHVGWIDDANAAAYARGRENEAWDYHATNAGCWNMQKRFATRSAKVEQQLKEASDTEESPKPMSRHCF